MLFSDSFFTINSSSEALYKERGSKFLGYAFPVTSQEQIKSHLDQLKKEHPSAVHCCYAWRLGADKSAFRINDDGEPSGSAGKPIYSQILSNDLTNVLIVVVRYFGGSLLGIPGLIQAYKTTAAEALSNNKIVEQFIQEDYQIEFEDDDISAVMHLLKVHEVQLLSQNYTHKHVVEFRIKKQELPAFENKLQSLYKTKLSYLKTS